LEAPQCPGFGGVGFWIQATAAVVLSSSYSTGVRMPWALLSANGKRPVRISRSVLGGALLPRLPAASERVMHAGRWELTSDASSTGAVPAASATRSCTEKTSSWMPALAEPAAGAATTAIPAMTLRSRSSKPVRRRNPSVGQFDSGAAPFEKSLLRSRIFSRSRDRTTRRVS
jgi:hypothetical protein